MSDVPTWLQRFKRRPREAAAVGIPLDGGAQLFLFSRNRTTPSTGIRVLALTYNSETDQMEVKSVIGPFNTSGTTFTGETSQSSSLGEFSSSQVLCAVSVNSDNITNPAQLWVAVLIRYKDGPTFLLCEGYVHSSHIPSWTFGNPGVSQLALADVHKSGAQATYQASILNSAMNSGNHSYTFTNGTGSRLELNNGQISNLDTSNRVGTVVLDDGANTIGTLVNGTINAGTGQGFPAAAAPAAAGSVAAAGARFVIAGANRLVATVAAVAVSQDSAIGVTFSLDGISPTITESAPCGATITINTERVEAA